MWIKSACKGLLSCLICFGILGAIPLYAQSAASPVVWKDTKLSVQFDNATMGQILNSISSATGIKLSVDPAVGSYRESVSFRGLSLREGILKVLEGSGIDYIVVGSPQSPQGVNQVLLLGYSPKGPVTPSAAPIPVAQAGQPLRPNPFATGVAANPFGVGQAVGEQVASPPADSGGFLPFPDASDNSNPENPQTDPAQKPAPPNPFNPNPAATPAPQTPSTPSAPVPDRRVPSPLPPGRR